MNEIDELLQIMQTLRDPVKGCPWDKEQTIDTILPYTREEVAELADAIERKDMEGLRDELGDILFHIVFYAQLANEAGYFNFQDVSHGVNEKLKRRHPHVFGDCKVGDIKQQSVVWEKIKEQERRKRSRNGDTESSLLNGISSTLPAFIRAQKLQRRAASVGFDWNSIEPVLDKIEEEIKELRQELKSNIDKNNIMDELGDLLFACVNFARHAKIDPEHALSNTNRKFEQRFKFIEQNLKARNKVLSETPLEEMEELWQQAKKRIT